MTIEMISLDGNKKIFPEGAIIEADFSKDYWVKLESLPEGMGFNRSIENVFCTPNENTTTLNPGDSVILRSGVVLEAK